jgi:hypothetical protein
MGKAKGPESWNRRAEPSTRQGGLVQRVQYRGLDDHLDDETPNAMGTDNGRQTPEEVAARRKKEIRDQAQLEATWPKSPKAFRSEELVRGAEPRKYVVKVTDTVAQREQKRRESIKLARMKKSLPKVEEPVQQPASDIEKMRRREALQQSLKKAIAAFPGVKTPQVEKSEQSRASVLQLEALQKHVNGKRNKRAA